MPFTKKVLSKTTKTSFLGKNTGKIFDYDKSSIKINVRTNYQISIIWFKFWFEKHRHDCFFGQYDDY